MQHFVLEIPKSVIDTLVRKSLYLIHVAPAAWRKIAINRSCTSPICKETIQAAEPIAAR